MTTLSSAPVAPLLARLFADADANPPAQSPAFAGVTSEDRGRMMRSKTDYRDFYAQLSGFALPVSREVGGLLYMKHSIAKMLPFGPTPRQKATGTALSWRTNSTSRSPTA